MWLHQFLLEKPPLTKFCVTYVDIESIDYLFLSVAGQNSCCRVVICACSLNRPAEGTHGLAEKPRSRKNCGSVGDDQDDAGGGVCLKSWLGSVQQKASDVILSLKNG